MTGSNSWCTFNFLSLSAALYIQTQCSTLHSYEEKVSVPLHPGQHLVCSILKFSHSNKCVVVFHHSFNLHFPIAKEVEYPFMCLLIIYISLVNVSCTFFNLVVSFLIEFWEFFLCSDPGSFVRHMLCNDFLLACGLSFHSFNSAFTIAEIFHFDEVQTITFLL